VPEHLEQFKWKKGQSGNPSGAKKGLARAAREAVGEDGAALAAFWLSIVNDDTQRSSDRLEASKLLAERGWGRPAQFQAMEGDPLGFDQIEQAAEQFRLNVLRLAPPGDEGPADSPVVDGGRD
jgi:Family of unknown function (DUF5681)